MASKQLHCIRPIATYQTGNILSFRTRRTRAPLLDLNIGVPQGSILGSLLFLIYGNDIINFSNILSFVRFADDITEYVQHDSIYGAIQILNLELAISNRMVSF